MHTTIAVSHEGMVSVTANRGEEQGERKRMRVRLTSRSRLLGSTTTPSWSTPTAGLEATTRALTNTAAAARSTTAREASAELFGTRAALLNLELDAVHGVRVGGNGSLVGSGSLEINECAVLHAS